jgi:hypothetical protein
MVAEPGSTWLPQLPNPPGFLWRSELHTAAILQIPMEHSAILTSSSEHHPKISNSKFMQIQ